MEQGVRTKTKILEINIIVDRVNKMGVLGYISTKNNDFESLCNVITKLEPPGKVDPKEELWIVIVSPTTYPDPGFVTANDANDAVPVTPEANVMATSAPVPAKLLVAGTK